MAFEVGTRGQLQTGNRMGCDPLVKRPKTKTGIGMPTGTNPYKTLSVNSSARILPNNRKDNDKGLENSSRMLIGKRKATGLRYLPG